MKDSIAFGLDMVSDLARNPKFAPEELERQRQQILSGLKVGYEDPDYIAGMVFDRLVYGFHPYGRPDSGTPQSIASITRDDLVAFHKAWFGANNAILAIVGDISHEEAFAGAERAFGKWGRSEATAAKPVEPPPPTRRVVVIDRPGAVQTEIRVGNIGLPRRHKDYLALDLAINILGGEGGNRLHRVLRSDRGLTYGASADVNALKDAGNIVADTDTRSEVTGEALRLIVDEFWKLQRQRVQEAELADAQAYLTGSFPLTIETPERDRAAGAQRRVLRSRPQRSADLSRARQRRSRRTTSSAWRASTCAPIGCRSCSSATRRCSPSSSPASASISSNGSRSPTSTSARRT